VRKITPKILLFASFLSIALFASSCSLKRPTTIGGSVVGLSGTGLVLEDNGGDDLTVTGTGTVPFTFKTSIASGGAYAVTIKTQPSGQVCSVSNGSGTATANITNVQVNCAATYTVGGTVSNLQGSGMVLQDNGGDNLTVSGTGTVNFTFATTLLAGANYAVTIKTQPTNPSQTCTVTNGSGTIVGSVSSVQVACSLPKFPIGGTVVGLVVGTGDTLELQDNAGDNLFVTGDVDFTFPTQFSLGSIYSVDLFLPPTSQPQGCNIFNATSVVKGIVSNVIVDCQHNDWAWMFGATTPTINNYGTAKLATHTVGTPIFAPPFAAENDNTPGGRDFAMTWTDKSGNRWLFGGEGLEVTHQNNSNIPGILNDMWVWPTTPNTGLDDGWWLPGGWVPANLPIVHDFLANSDTADITSLQFSDQAGNYGTLGVGVSCKTPGSACTVPPGRWGGITWTDATGNLWMFGGQGGGGLLSDIWEFDLTSGPCSYDLTTGTGIFTNCQWIWKAGSNLGNQPTTATFPGGRWGPASYTDNAGNVWMFGGQGYDSTPAPGTVGLLNDLWKYNIAAGTWTLVSGTTTANQNGVYGTQGTAAAANLPGGRQTAVLWVDATGKVWLFGGFGLDSKGTSGTTQTGSQQIGSVLNDLWSFDPVAGQWTWVSGSNLANQNGVYGTQGISNATTNAAATNVPGSRWGSAGWVSPDGNLFLFGGFGYGSNGTQPTGFLNDVWEFELNGGTNQWIWWKGSVDVDQPGTYITSPINYFQLSYVNNAVGGRRGAAHWAPKSSGFVYVFGGEGYDATAGGPYGLLNDVWHYLSFPTP
jgi:Galactose oxidase, central domain